MSHILRTSTEHKTASLADEGNYAYCQSSGAHNIKDTVALQMLHFLKIKIFISLDSCQFVEYLFKIKIYIFQVLNTKKGDNVSFVYFYKIITFV